MLVLFVLLGFLGLAVAVAAVVLAMKYKEKPSETGGASNDEDRHLIDASQDDHDITAVAETGSDPAIEPTDTVGLTAEPKEDLVTDEDQNELKTDPEMWEDPELENTQTAPEDMASQLSDGDPVFGPSPEEALDKTSTNDANTEGASMNSSALEHWLAQEHQDEIMDFTVWDERLMIVYDDQSEEDPIVMLERDCVVPDRQYVVMNGVRIAAVDNAGDLTLDHIVLVGQSMLDAQIAA